MEKYTVSEEYLDRVTLEWSKSLVGKIMKRFEIHDDKNAIKREVKELIYEGIRGLKTNIKAFNWGVKFKNRTSSEQR